MSISDYAPVGSTSPPLEVVERMVANALQAGHRTPSDGALELTRLLVSTSGDVPFICRVAMREVERQGAAPEWLIHWMCSALDRFGYHYGRLTQEWHLLRNSSKRVLRLQLEVKERIFIQSQRQSQSFRLGQLVAIHSRYDIVLVGRHRHHDVWGAPFFPLDGPEPALPSSNLSHRL